MMYGARDMGSEESTREYGCGGNEDVEKDVRSDKDGENKG